VGGRARRPLLIALHPAVLSWVMDPGSGWPAASRWSPDDAARDGARDRLGDRVVGRRRAAGLRAGRRARRAGRVDTASLAIGGYTLAWAVGFLVVVAPAGPGAGGGAGRRPRAGADERRR
jgi:hypothetical protein